MLPPRCASTGKIELFPYYGNVRTFPVRNFLELQFSYFGNFYFLSAKYFEIELSGNFVFQFGKLNLHILEIAIYFQRISELFPENSREFLNYFQTISKLFPD